MKHQATVQSVGASEKRSWAWSREGLGHEGTPSSRRRLAKAKDMAQRLGGGEGSSSQRGEECSPHEHAEALGLGTPWRVPGAAGRPARLGP